MEVLTFSNRSSVYRRISLNVLITPLFFKIEFMLERVLSVLIQKHSIFINLTKLIIVFQSCIKLIADKFTVTLLINYKILLLITVLLVWLLGNCNSALYGSNNLYITGQFSYN